MESAGTGADAEEEGTAALVLAFETPLALLRDAVEIDSARPPLTTVPVTIRTPALVLLLEFIFEPKSRKGCASGLSERKKGEKR